MILEISRKYLKEFYNNNLEKIVKAKDGILWNEETIKKAFNFGNGTQKDFKRYQRDNSKYCIFVTV